MLLTALKSETNSRYLLSILIYLITLSLLHPALCKNKALAKCRVCAFDIHGTMLNFSTFLDVMSRRDGSFIENHYQKSMSWCTYTASIQKKQMNHHYGHRLLVHILMLVDLIHSSFVRLVLQIRIVVSRKSIVRNARIVSNDIDK